MESLTWIASTAEGAQLGQTAAASVQVVRTLSPWYTAPLEPLRWFFTIVGTAPHVFYTMGFFVVLSFLVGIMLARRSTKTRLPDRLAVMTSATLTVLLSLGGAFFAMRTLDTWLPGGVEWITPPNASFRLANLHAHSQASGGALMPEDIVLWHYNHGFRVMALSDSNGLRGIERARARIEQLGLPMILVPAEEYRGSTHMLLLNIKTPIIPSEADVPHAIAQAKEQGGFVVIAHPWTSDRTPQELVAWGAGGFEVSNGNVIASATTRALADQGHLAEIGDLDFRTGNRPFTATVLPLWADSPQRVQEALARGASAALYFPDEIEEGNFHLLSNLRRNMATLVREQWALMLGGIAFWVLVGVVLRGRRLPPARPLPAVRGMLAIGGLVVLTVAFASWCMWWQFRTGWLPRSEWALYWWALTTPLSWTILRRTL